LAMVREAPKADVLCGVIVYVTLHEVPPVGVLANTVSATVVDAVMVPEVPVDVPVMVTTAEVVVGAELLAANVITLVAVAGLVPKVAVTPLGRPDAASVTAPVNPPRSPTVIVSLPPEPWVTDNVAAEGVSVKLCGVEATTVKVIVVEAVRVPDVPPMVTRYAPAVAELLAANVTTLAAVAGFVPNVAVTPLGRPVAASVTAPVKPPTSATVIVPVELEPCVTESVAADGVNVKPGGVDGVTVKVIVVVAVSAPLVAVMVTTDDPVAAVLLAVNVSTLLAVVGFVENAAVTPVGNPDALRVTLPVKHTKLVVVMVSVAVPP